MPKWEVIEQQLLLEGIYLKYGYDFRQYAESSLHRRLQSVLSQYQIDRPIDLLKKILDDRNFFCEILPKFTINTTEFFRDPDFYKSLLEHVIPTLKTYPHSNIWIAGCSSGEEVYSLAILLSEADLLNRTTIYATDINPLILKKAREGIYPSSSVQVFTKNYAAAGGRRSPSEYYIADYGLARFDPKLRENVVFSEHNLAIDSVFTEAQLILCRNVLIYFNRSLQDRVLKLFLQSLSHRGYLGLGSKETVRFSDVANVFDTIDNEQKIFQKKSPADKIVGVK